ncbi:Pectinesterase inhibitor domain [Sesbania bispinosa]|nr:Pectinesterase inhibitor domain [Sesbania bispinosa]
MAERLLSLSFLVLSLVLYMAASTAESAVARRPNPNPIDFIKSSCRATLYPAVCVQSLMGYANVIRQDEHQLAITALNVSVWRTRSSASFMKKMSKVKGIKPRDYGAVQDCKENMDNSVDRLNQSVKELGLTGKALGQDPMWHMSNVQTWVSAALTDQNTCLDGFASPHVDRKLKATISARVVDVSQVTSNALALVNRFASRYRTAAHN